MPTFRSSLVPILLLAACQNGDRPKPIRSEASTRLLRYQTCEALESDLKALVLAEARADLEQYRDYPWSDAEDGGDGEPASGGDDDSGGDGRDEGEDYSGTNNQEDGVDEADLVKTDGYHIYTLNGNRLHIFGVPEFGQLIPESVTELEGHPRELLVDRDAEKAAIFSMVNVGSLPEEHPLRALVGYPDDDDESRWYYRINELTKITVLDISDRTNPSLVREVYVEGWYDTAREIGGSVRMASYSYLHLPFLWELWSQWYENEENVEATMAWAEDQVAELTVSDFVPQVYIRAADGSFVTQSLTGSACNSFQRPTDSRGRGLVSLISFDLFGETLAFDHDHVLANYPTFYASKDMLVITEPANDWWWFWTNEDDAEMLNVHAFDISQPGTTSYLASGRVEGTLFDPFSIDEEDGFLRLATTTNRWARWWQEDPAPPENHIFVLGASETPGQMAIVGHVGDIAPGEQIMSARLVGDKGYLVTFEQVDPLFTLDLSNPSNPKVVGELKVPGFSTYLHPIADGKLLAIGYGGDDEGTNWETQISLFDVSNFAAPKLDTTLPIAMDADWAWSEALYEHKAFTYWGKDQLLAVPQSSYAYVGETEEGWSDYRYTSRLQLVHVDAEGGKLTQKGTIDHSDFYNQASDEYRWWHTDVRRSIFMGDYIYVLSDLAITVHKTADLGQVTEQTLPGYQPSDEYWWW
jgi:hypothetical protein